jgi:HEAT repeat protein
MRARIFILCAVLSAMALLQGCEKKSEPAEKPKPTTVEGLLDSVRDPQILWDARAAVGDELAAMCPAAEDKLLAALKDENWHVRQIAVYALGKTKDPKVVEPMIACLKDGEENVRSQAIEAIIVLNDKQAVEPLLGVMEKDTDVDTRNTAVRALGSLKDTRAVEPLLVAMKSSDNILVLAAIGALADIGDPRAVDALISRTRQYETRSSATAALGNFRTEKSFQALLKLTESKDPFVRSAAAFSLAKIGDPRAIPAIRNLEADKAANVRAAAAEALKAIEAAPNPLPATQPAGAASSMPASAPGT